MTTTEKVFNQYIDSDVVAFRIVQAFKMALEKDEWYLTSTEDCKVLALYQSQSDNSRQVATDTLNQMGYSVINENTYFGGPLAAIKYFPNPENKTRHERRLYCLAIYRKYTDKELVNPSAGDTKIIVYIKEELKKGEELYQINFSTLI